MAFADEVIAGGRSTGELVYRREGPEGGSRIRTRFQTSKIINYLVYNNEDTASSSSLLLLFQSTLLV